MKSSVQKPNHAIHCPRCGHLVSRNGERCIHCGLPRPGFYHQVPILGELIRGQISFVNQIVLACFILYALSIMLDIRHTVLAGGIFNTLSPSSNALYSLGMGGAIPLATGRWWTLITAMYLHGGILHILFNMLWLRQIGPLVEDLFGGSRFWIIYTLAGIIGAFTSAMAGTNFFVGASGAVFGLFGALIYYGRHRGGTFGSNIFRQMLIWAVIGFLFGILMPGVDNWGHAGGFVGGLLIAILLGYKERSKSRLGHHLVAFGLLLVVIASFGLMFINFFK